MFSRLGLIFAVIALTCAAGATTVRAQFTSKAEFALLLDVETGATLFEKKADDLMQPASMSKLITVAVLFKLLKEGKLSLTQEFVASEYAWRKGGAPSGTAAMFVPINTPVKIEELLPGIIVQSGNDACIIVAEGIAGTEDAFSEVMNDYARKIGMMKSNFTNSSGLPEPNHVTTARELAMLALHIYKEYPEYYPLFKQKEFSYRKHKFFNRNPLIYLNIGADGMKTGHTEASGFGMVVSAESGGRRLIAVLNGLPTANERREEAVRMLNWGFNSFRKTSLFQPGQEVGDARVWGGEKRYVKLRADSQINILLPRVMRDKKVDVQIVYQGPLKPPIKSGEKIAELVVSAENGVSNRAPLYAAEDVEKGGVIAQGFDSLLILAFGWLL